MIKSDNVKGSFYEELGCVYLIRSLGMTGKFCWVISMRKLIGKIFSNRQSGMRVHTKLVMIMVLE
jgi:hypothetical protein